MVPKIVMVGLFGPKIGMIGLFGPNIIYHKVKEKKSSELNKVLKSCIFGFNKKYRVWCNVVGKNMTNAHVKTVF